MDHFGFGMTRGNMSSKISQNSETNEILQRQVLKGTQVSSEGDYFEGKLDGPVFLLH